MTVFAASPGKEVPTPPTITMNLDQTLMTQWAQVVITALSSPVTIILGVGIGGLIIGKARGLI